MKPGEFILKDEDIEINKNQISLKLLIKNIGDRPIQVGSHYHFFEANKYLEIFKDHPYIFNLGHGVLPETDPNMVDYLVKLIKDFKDAFCFFQMNFYDFENFLLDGFVMNFTRASDV